MTNKNWMEKGKDEVMDKLNKIIKDTKQNKGNDYHLTPYNI